MNSFRIEFQLGTPVVDFGEPIHIDALLGSVNNGDHGLTTNCGFTLGSHLFFVDHPMIDGARINNMDLQRNIRGWTRRLEHFLCASEYIREDGVLGKNRIGRFSKTPSIASGKRKNYGGSIDSQIHARWHSVAVAWGCGDIDKVGRLTKMISNIGPKRRLGYGAVLSVKIVLDNNAKTYAMLRALPEHVKIPEGFSFAPVFTATKGPYWDSSNRETAQVYVGQCPINFDQLSINTSLMHVFN